MKAKKVLKQIAKIEALMSKVTQRSSPHIRELLQDAEAAITRAKKAVQASSGTAKRTPAKGAEQPSGPTAEPTKPRRKLSAAGRRAISEATKKRWAAQRAANNAAVKKVAAKKATPVKAATPVQEVPKAPAKKASVKAAKAPTRKLVKKAPVKKAAVKAPAKKAIRVMQVAKTPVSPTTAVTTPEQVAPGAPVQ